MKSENKQASLLDRWKKSGKNKSSLALVSKAPTGTDIPLSSGQQRLWFLQQLYPTSTFYNATASLELEGLLLVGVLKESIVKVFNENEILKSSYPLIDGLPIIRINKNLKIEINEVDFTGLSDIESQTRVQVHIAMQAATQFDLACGPLFQISLVRQNSSKHILFLTVHHIIIDLWSIGLLKGQIATYYKQFSRGDILNTERNDIQYTDYAYWQRNREIDKIQLKFWKDNLSGELPILDLQTDRKRPVQPSYKGKNNRQEFSKEFSSVLLGIARSLDVTPFILFLSAYYVLLRKYTLQDDIIIGTPISVRNDKSLENLLGFFIETLVFRNSIDSEYSFSEFIGKVRQNVLESFENKGVPFDELVKALKIERRLATNPIFQTMFVYDSEAEFLSFGDDLKVANDFEFDSNVAKFDLTLFVIEKEGKLSLKFEYATDIFEESTILRFQEHLKLILEAVAENPKYKIKEIPMLTSQEKDFFLRSPSVAEKPFSGFEGIHDIIFDFAEKTPTAIAAICKDSSITYDEVYKRAIALEALILNYSKGENKIIGLALDRSVDIVIGILAILNAGCAYLPIDIDYPKQRIDYMLKDAEVGLVLTQNIFKSDFEMRNVPTISIDDEHSQSGMHSDTRRRHSREDDIAYVIYTSGSTGNPKGVPITHKNIINATEGRLSYYKENPTVFLLMSSIAFDSSKAGIFWTLCTGGTLLISEKRIEQDIEKLCKIITENKVTHTLMLPSLYKLLLEFGEVINLEKLNTVIVAGETCPTTLGSIHFNKLTNTKLYNEYGPTEATVWCAAYELLREDTNETVPIGKPVANAHIFLLDKSLQLVPYGAVGEIYIGGPGLAGTYLKRPELTRKMYVRASFDISGSSLLYKTGDKGRYNNQGNLEFLGRIDQQIKIRGFRVELEETERAIAKNQMVQEAVVLLIEKETNSSVNSEKRGIKYLVAYMTVEESYEQNLLKNDLNEAIPDYMVPSSFIVMDEFPRLPNGKVDKTALKKIKTTVDEKKQATVSAPIDPIHKKLVAIWEEVLDYSPVDVNDNFFELGGDSISSIQIIAKARKAGIQLKANQLFDSQTIAELALFAKTESPDVKATEIIIGEVSLTPIQHWFFEIHKAAPHYWNQIVHISKIELVPISILKSITKELISYHDALRLSFIKTENEWKAKVLGPDEINCFYSFDVTNCSNLINQDEQIDRTMISIQQKCNLASGNLFKVLYFECGKIQANKVFFVAHHLVTDMVSWNALFGDFSTAVQHSLLGKEIGFKIKTSSIADWGQHLRELSTSDDIKNEMPFWTSQNTDCAVLPTDFEIKSDTFEENRIKVHTSTISKEESNLLLTSANDAYHTKIEDLMIASLVITFGNWGKLENLSIGLERHGRNIANELIDVSNTMGWFTSFFPMKFQKSKSGDIGDSIKSVKEHLRSIPNDGIGFGILKYLSNNNSQLEFTNHNPQLVFNYLGTIGNSYSDSELRFNFQGHCNRDPLSERTYAIEINVFVSDGKLHINWSYSEDAYQESTFFGLVDTYLKNLKKITDHCVTKVNGEYTPSDFPEAGLDQDDLDELMKLL